MQESSIVRVFVSSTFSDFKIERDALHERVFPRLQELCNSYGARFQAVDLRWGVSREDTISQRTMEVCLKEIARAQELSPRPNFLLLIGDRWGSQPLPDEIPPEDYRMIESTLKEDEIKLLARWYREDLNAIPSRYILLERTGKYVNQGEWRKTEKKLGEIFRKVLNDLEWDKDNIRRWKYGSSATEKEAQYGVFHRLNATDQVVCVMRSLHNLPKGDEAKKANQYIDFDLDESRVDNYAQSRLGEFKQRLERKVQNSIIKFETNWIGDTINTDYLESFCEGIFNQMSRMIIPRLKMLVEDEKERISQEIQEHNRYAINLIKSFIGRNQALASINSYINQPDVNTPYIVFGISGSGKSSLIAKSSLDHKVKNQHAVILTRFIGRTPHSFDISNVVESLCEEIRREYNREQQGTEGDERPYDMLIRHLSFATKERPLILFLDAVNQFTRASDVLPVLIHTLSNLPPYTRVVLSTTPELIGNWNKNYHKQTFYEIENMSIDEVKLLLNQHLSQSNRTLQESQREYVMLQYAKCPLPLFLKLSIEEVKSWRSWDNKKNIIPSISGVIHKYLYELEKEYGRVLVSKSLSYLVLSRYGLTEEEWFGLLSNDRGILEEFLEAHPDSPNTTSLPFVIYSQFYYDLSPYLTQRNKDGDNYYALFHNQFERVIHQRYLQGGRNKEIIIREDLVTYFTALKLNRRTIDEYLWQVKEMKDWSRLKEMITDEGFLVQAATLFYEPYEYFNEVLKHLGCTMKNLFQECIDKPTHFSTAYLNSVFVFLGNYGLLEESAKIEQTYLQKKEEEANHLTQELADKLLLGYRRIIHFYIMSKDYQMALDSIERAINIFEKKHIYYEPASKIVFYNQAGYFYKELGDKKSSVRKYFKGNKSIEELVGEISSSLAFKKDAVSRYEHLKKNAENAQAYDIVNLCKDWIDSYHLELRSAKQD